MKMTDAGIYMICCLLNGKYYIGSSSNLRNRKNSHWLALQKNKHHNPILQASWNKHGAENFSYKVVERCEVQWLLEREQWWIDNHNPQYNILKIAGSPRGHKWSAEAKLKSSERQKGKIISEETRQKIANTLNGRTVPRDVVERSAASRRGKKGRRPTAEQIEKISSALKGRKNGPRSPEVRARIALSHVGMLHSEETKAKIAANRRGKGCGKRPAEVGFAIAKAKAKLDERQIREIRRLCASGATQRSVAALTGVNKTTIGQIVRRQSYVWAQW